MKHLLWKKWIELKKSPIKIILAIILPSLLYFMYYYIFKVSYHDLFILLPLVATAFSTYIFFNVDDIAYAIFYFALGIKMKKVWTANIIFVITIEYILSEIVLLVLALISSPPITLEMIVLNLGNFIIIMALIGLSTIHYSDSGTFTTILASVSAIVNFLLVIVPLFINKLGNYHLINYILISVSILIFALCYLKVNRANSEQLIMNTQIYIYGYDKKFIEED